MTQEEILDIFFEDLELPNLVRTTLKETPSRTWKRAGITTAGSPTQINLIRTMRNSFGRRLALKRPSLADVEALRSRARSAGARAADAERRATKIAALKEQLAQGRSPSANGSPLSIRVDVRFNAFTEQPVPTSQAVMFCLMDVSGSMGEREKDLAKRFYMLLHLFLKRRYEKVDIVFIRHTHDAQEVDEQEFFYSRQSGGTIVSTALDKMLEIQKRALRHRRLEHLCGAGLRRLHAIRRCAALRGDAEQRHHAALPVLRLYRNPRRARDGGVRVSEDSGAELWRAYRTVAEGGRISRPSASRKPADIFPVFRELFKKDGGVQ